MTGLVLPGLCSITLRDHSTREVIALAEQAGLAAIEWGADRHIQPGDTATAAVVARQCHDAGIACPSYGSYVMASQTSPADIDTVCVTATALGATNVRIWTPFGVTTESANDERQKVSEAVADAADQAAGHDLTVSLEYHPDTLTETAAAAMALLTAAARPNLFTYWQPDAVLDDAAAVAELATVLADLSHLHVFKWGSGFNDRLALHDGESLWRTVLDISAVRTRWAGDRYAFLEYVRDDDPDQLRRDAHTLLRWLHRREPWPPTPNVRVSRR